MEVVNAAALADAVRERAPGEPLDRVEAALVVSQELASGAEELIGRVVADARRAGCSWTEIGQPIGAVEQAARRRLAGGAPRVGRTGLRRETPCRGVLGQLGVSIAVIKKELECYISPGTPRRRRRGKAAGLACSFCGKPRTAELRLVAGPGVYICAECVGLCNEILSEEAGDPAA